MFLWPHKNTDQKFDARSFEFNVNAIIKCITFANVAIHKKKMKKEEDRVRHLPYHCTYISECFEDFVRCNSIFLLQNFLDIQERNMQDIYLKLKPIVVFPARKMSI